MQNKPTLAKSACDKLNPHRYKTFIEALELSSSMKKTIGYATFAYQS
jgi:hypothetical protein